MPSMSLSQVALASNVTCRAINCLYVVDVLVRLMFRMIQHTMYGLIAATASVILTSTLEALGSAQCNTYK